MVFLQVADGITKTVAIPGTDLVHNSTTAGIGKHRFVAFGGASGNAQNGANRLLLTTSIDEGRSWTTPRALSDELSSPPQSIKLRLGGAGVLDLVWIQTLLKGNSALRHIRSSDYGATWSEENDLPISSNVSSFDAVVDGCGNVHVILENVQPVDDVSLTHAVWRGSWSAVKSVFPDYAFGDPALARRPDGSVALAVNGRARKAGTGALVQTHYAELR